MAISQDTSNILSILDRFELFDADDVAMQMATDLRRRRIEKNITRRKLADDSGVPVSNITRFEQKGLISLKHLILIAKAMGYIPELKSVFSEPKYDTMDELMQIKNNTGKKRAYEPRN